MSRNTIVVFSGGSAANSILGVFDKVAQDRGCSLDYVIPISDNGGSSSEIIRVLGGPGIGDLRSRLVRLIPENTASDETGAVKALFNHRLSSTSPEAARLEWLDIVEARHPSIWTDISSEKRELIRAFLLTINLEIVKRARPSSVFNFQSASVGNLFLTAARIFTGGSLESAIYLLKSITGVPSGVSVIPCINTNFTHHICAALADGSTITGQNAISHPLPVVVPQTNFSFASDYERLSQELLHYDRIEDANIPGSLPSLRQPNIAFHKSHTEDLPARISRIYYINPYGHELRLPANPKVLTALGAAHTVIYSIGSLFTSIVPCLILADIGAALANPAIRQKILILNGSVDRETGPSSAPFGALDFVRAIAGACAASHRPGYSGSSGGADDSIHWADYVTHVIHMEGEGVPKVEREGLWALGIDTVRVYGRRNPEGGMFYDEKALAGAIEALVGGRRKEGSGPSRRNTLIG